MKLRWQLVLAFAAAAAMPILVATYGARELIHDRYKAFADKARRIGDEMNARLDTSLRTERGRLRQFCEGDVLIDKLLTDLAAGRSPDLQDHLRAAMEGRGLDTLEVVDPRGRVLGSGHLPGAVDSIDERTRDLSHSAGTRYVLRDVRVRTQDGVRPVLVLEHTCEAEGLHRRVGVAGGVYFSRILGGLSIERQNAQVFVLDGQGHVISPGDASYPPRPSYPRRDVLLHNPDGTVAATLVVAVPDEALRDDVHRLQSQLFLALAAGLGLSLVLALMIARRIASPLDRLARGVAAIAEGELDQRIDVRGSREINRLVEAFNQMAKDLKATRARMLRAERVAAWREIARRIAHEIKNPLFPIQTSMETLRKTYRAQHPEFGEILEEATTTVLEEVERVKRIVTEFSQFARMPKPKPQELVVEEVVAHVVGLFSGGPGPIVRAGAGASLPPIRADREQLIQILLNLVQNARDAAEGLPDANVQIDARPTSQGVTIEVMDNGTGMTEEIRGRMFEPYFTTKATGTGLGLAIVHRIVMEHGGVIEVRCPTGGGTTVSVSLTREGPALSPEESQGERELAKRDSRPGR